MGSDFEVKVWPKGEQIDLTHIKLPLLHIKPIELHMKADGAVGDTPSLLFVLCDAYGRHYVAQITENMLRAGLEECAGAREVIENADRTAATHTASVNA